MPSDEVILRPGIPRYLYKYRPFNIFCLRLLTLAEICYSDPRDFNDPLDCNPSIQGDVDVKTMGQLLRSMLCRTQSQDQIDDEMNRYLYSSEEYGDWKVDTEAAEYLRLNFVRRVSQELRQELGKKGVLSLSERWDSLLMWSHYADQHRGVCVQFDTTELDHPSLRPVDYGNRRSIKASDLVSWKLYGSQEAEQRALDTFFYSKAPNWHYEEEWRDLSESSGPRTGRFRLSGIYFGFRCDPAVVQSVVALSASQPEVQLYRVFPDANKFDLMCAPVEREEILSRGLRVPAEIEFNGFFQPTTGDDDN